MFLQLSFGMVDHRDKPSEFMATQTTWAEKGEYQECGEARFSIK